LLTTSLIGLISLDGRTVNGVVISFVDGNGDKLIGRYYQGSIPHGVLLLEGFGSDQNALRSVLREYINLGFHAMSFDYSGQGQSSDVLGFDNAATDRLANQTLLAKEEFKNLSGLNDSEILLFGHSMGARVALQAATIETQKVNGLVLFGTQINLDINIQSNFFTGVNDSDLEWIQNLNATNPDVDILLLSGMWDDICTPQSAQLLYNKLSSGSGNASRELLLLQAMFHNYEVYAPRAIAKAIQWSQEQAETPILRGPIRQVFGSNLRIVFWFVGLTGLFLSFIFGTQWISDYRKSKLAKEEIRIIDSHIYPEIITTKRYLWMKLLILLASLPIAVIIASLILLIPVGVPIFNIIYVAIFGGYGLLLMLLFRAGKMPGTKGKWQPKIKSFAETFIWKNQLWMTLSFIGILVYIIFFTNSGFFYIYPLNSRLLWLFLFTIFSIPGFYIAQIEMNMVRKITDNLNRYSILNTLIVLIPFFLQTIFYLALRSISGFLGGIHGLIILMIVFLAGNVFQKLGKNAFMTALLQSLLLQLLVLPQGSLFLVFY
jgi:pimeloyl-ACP methyl ester carboxylesterase